MMDRMNGWNSDWPINFWPIFQFVLDNLSGNVEYVLMICAATKRLSNPNKTWLGEPSSEKVVFLPEDKCDLGKWLVEDKCDLGHWIIQVWLRKVSG